MKLQTHIAFSIGASSILASIIDKHFLGIGTLWLWMCLSLSLLINILIDKYGHEKILVKYGVVYRRAPHLHSLNYAPLTACLSLILVPILYINYTTYIASLIPTLYAIGLIIVLTHLLLDYLTENGIYIKKRGNFVRISCCNFKYNNPTINYVFTIAGIVMLLTAIYNFLSI